MSKGTLLMTSTFRHIDKLSFILLFTLTACEEPPKKKCDAECRTCIMECIGGCQEGANSCFKASMHSNVSAFQTCQYYAQQCALDCPEKCMKIKEKK